MKIRMLNQVLIIISSLFICFSNTHIIYEKNNFTQSFSSIMSILNRLISYRQKDIGVDNLLILDHN